MSAAAPSFDDCRYTFFDSQGSCRADRNCAECLQKKGCRIGAGGLCEPENTTSGLSFKLAVAANLSLPAAKDNSSQQAWVFPASETTYCDANDTICAQCSDANYWLPSGVAIDSRFCVGANGCVCVLNCKASFQASLLCSPTNGSSDAVATPASVGPVPANQAAESKPHSVSFIVWIVLGIIAVLLCVMIRFVYRSIRDRRHKEVSSHKFMPGTAKAKAVGDSTPVFPLPR